MTTSGTSVWSMTAYDFVRAALTEGAILPAGGVPEATELEDSILRLNGMLKSWSMKGVSLFRESSVNIPTVAATAALTLPADVRDVSTARIIVSATQERPLYRMERTDYNSLPNKTSVGSPTMYYVERGRDATLMYLWPVSANPVTLRLDYDRLPDTITNSSETLDVRQELYETVWSNLALRIAGLFGAEPKGELVARAQMLEMQMFDAERPDSYRFETGYDYD